MGEVLETVFDAFSGNSWPLAFVIYLLVGWALIRPTGNLWSRFMSALGWPLEIVQRLSGATGLPYLFIIPNFLIFGMFTFAPLFAGGENYVRLLGETNPDSGRENFEDDKFLKAVADTLIFVVFQVPIMIFFALATALALNRDIRGRGFWRSVFFYPVMLSPPSCGP